MLLGAQPDETGAQEGSRGEVERPLGLGGAQARHLGALAPGKGWMSQGAQIHQRQEPRRRSLPDLQPRLAIALDEAGAENPVAARHLGEGGGERRRRERPGEAVGGGYVVGRAPRRQAVEEPEPLLRVGEWRAASAKGRGASGGRAGPAAASPEARARATAAARPAIVGESKTCCTGRSAPSAARRRDSRRMARSEWPPRWKKSSSTPTGCPRDRPRRSSQIPAITSSTGLRGGVRRRVLRLAGRPRSGDGSARRSTLPLALSGSSARGTKSDGTMCSGRLSRRWSRRSAGAGPSAPSGTSSAARQWPPTEPVRRRRPRRPPSPPRRVTPGWRRSALSTSPGSTRKPRTLTWKSRRPRKSSVPSGRHRARSPVR